MFSTPLYRIDRHEGGSAHSQPAFLHSVSQPPGATPAKLFPLDPGNPAEVVLAALYSCQKSALAASLFCLGDEIKRVELHLLVYHKPESKDGSLGENLSRPDTKISRPEAEFSTLDVEFSRLLISLPVNSVLKNYCYQQGKLWLLERFACGRQVNSLVTVATLDFVREEQQPVTRIWFLPNKIDHYRYSGSQFYRSQLPFFLHEDRFCLVSDGFSEKKSNSFVICDVSLAQRPTKQLFPSSLVGDRYARPLLTRRISSLVRHLSISIGMCANGWFRLGMDDWFIPEVRENYYFSPDLMSARSNPRRLKVDEEGILDMEEADLSTEQLHTRKYRLTRIEDLPEIKE